LNFFFFFPTDINECLTNHGGCDENANCNNIQGGFECACKEGYLGDGLTCIASNQKDESNQAIGIGVGIGVGLLALFLLVLLLLFLRKRNVLLFINHSLF